MTARPMPQAPEAERAVLGGLMMDPERMSEVSEVIGPEDFYREAHQRLFRLMQGMHRAGEPTEMLAVIERVVGTRLEALCGGLHYVSALPDNIPSTENLEHYARIVRDRAFSRRLISVSRELADAAYSGEHTPAELRELAESRVFAATAAHSSSAWKHVSGLVDARYAYHQEVARDRSKLDGIPTGFADLDRLLAGLHRTDLVILAARPAMGKAQPVDEPVLTPGGYRPMGSLRVGDRIIGADGQPKTVLGVFPQGKRPVYRVTMSDGTWARCCDEHLWTTSTRNDRRSRGDDWRVRSLEQIRSTIRRPDSQTANNHALPVARPVEFNPSAALPVDPYLLGVLLGDGKLGGSSITLHNSERDIIERAVAALPDGDEARGIAQGVRIIRPGTNAPSEVKRALVSMGLECRSVEKRIPRDYLTASVADRERLLQGLNDTDGHIAGGGGLVEYSTSSAQLAKDYIELVQSLGGRARSIYRERPTYSYMGERRVGAPNWRIYSAMSHGVVPVASSKHLARYDEAKARGLFTIAKVEPDGEAECRCIMVEGEHYLTRSAIVTHNTAAALNIALNVASRSSTGVGVFSLEMGGGQLVDRLMCVHGRVDAGKLRTATLSQEDWKRLSQAADDLHKLPIHVDDTPAQTITQMRSKARRLKLVDPSLGLLVVDYIGLAEGDASTRQEAVAEVSRGLKVVAKELDVCVLCLSQLNRQVEQRSNKRPLLSDLRESGAIEQDADVVMFIYRDEYYNPETTTEPGVAEFIVSKQRNGSTGTVKLAFQANQTRFENLAGERRVTGMPTPRDFGIDDEHGW